MSVERIGNGLVRVGVKQEDLEESIAGLQQLKPILVERVIRGNGKNREQGMKDAKELAQHFDTATDAMTILLSGFSEYREEQQKGECSMRVYISGAITGNPNYKEQFREVEEKLKKKGYITINPANLESVMPEDASHREYMDVCIELLHMSDAICMVPGWRGSKGAEKEYEYAILRGRKFLNLRGIR